MNTHEEAFVDTLQRQIDDLNQKYIAINQALNNATNTPMEKLSIRLSKVEAQQDAIAQTILIDPEKALTARLLREQQQDLDAKLEETQKRQTELNNKIDNITTAVVAIPLGGFILSLVSSLVIYLLRKSKTHKNDPSPS